MLGETTACPRTNPEVFKKQYGKIIVVGEFLNLISDKMRTLDHNEIVLYKQLSIGMDREIEGLPV